MLNGLFTAGEGLAPDIAAATQSAFPRTEAREQLRRQVGTLRFDLNVLAEAKGNKADKKKALALKQDFIKSVSSVGRGGRPVGKGHVGYCCRGVTGACPYPWGLLIVVPGMACSFKLNRFLAY